MNFIKFPKIRQFRDVIMSVKRRGTFAGLDENGEPIYNSGLTLPTLRCIGTVKMHGRNSAVSIELNTREISAQSRSNIITEDNDNAGFARFVNGVPKEAWDFMVKNLLSPFIIENDANSQVTVFGEWIGPGVQHGVGISNIPNKSFVVFGVYVGERDDENGYWIPIQKISSFNGWTETEFEYGFKSLNDHGIYLITDVSPVYEIDIDFNHPQLIQNKLVDLTMAIEESCPVAKFFGADGIGEGIVWRPLSNEWSDSEFWFKTKGEKHSASKVKTIAAVDTIKVQGVIDFVDLTVTERRLEQGLEYLAECGKPMSKASTGDYVRWVINDVLTEETAVLDTSNLTAKDVSGHLGTKARQWFFNYLNPNLDS